MKQHLRPIEVEAEVGLIVVQSQVNPMVENLGLIEAQFHLQVGNPDLTVVQTQVLLTVVKAEAEVEVTAKVEREVEASEVEIELEVQA